MEPAQLQDEDEVEVDGRVYLLEDGAIVASVTVICPEETEE